MSPTSQGGKAENPHSYTITALEKGLKVLSLLADHPDGLKLTEAATLANVPAPTAFRILRTLRQSGYVRQDADNRYYPGLAILGLGFAALQGNSLVNAAVPALERLAQETNETVNLAVLEGLDILYLYRIKNADLVTTNLTVGSKLPAECTSIGKVLLAFLDDPDREGRLSSIPVGRCGGPNAMNERQLAKELAEVRSRGWAVQDEEIAYGLRSVAVPIRSRNGSVIAGLNVAVQASRWTSDRLVAEVLPLATTAATQTSRALGYSTIFE